MIPKLASTLLVVTVLFIGGINPNLTRAEEGKNTEGTSSVKVSVDSTALDESLKKIESQKVSVELLAKRRDENTGRAREVLERRLDKANLELLAQGIAYATKVFEQQKNGVDLVRHVEQAITILEEQYHIANSTIQSIRSRLEKAEQDLSMTQQPTTAYIDILDAQDSDNRAYEIIFENTELLRKFNIDTSQKVSVLKKNIEDIAVSRSILLEIWMHDVNAVRESAALTPNDKEVQKKLSIYTKHLKALADNCTPLLTIMDNLAMDTSVYREQIINATGTVSADVVQVGVITDLLVGWGKTLWAALIEDGPDFLFKALLFLIILYISNKLSKIMKKIVENGLERPQLQLSELLRRMVVSLVRNIILIIGFLIALSQVGVALGPLLAGFGIIGFVIGFALQNTLSNFASGFMILMYRPYDVGDLIESGGITGRVSHMSLVNTTMLTFDNQTIVVPNSKIWGEVIKNVTAQTCRRVDMVFGISYSDDIAKAEKVLQQIINSHDKVLPEPAPIIKLHELGESSVNFVVRPWVNKEDYWDVYWDITRTVKITFDKEGLSIPFPQRDVHLYPQKVPD